jgi:hypothetical protein
MVNIFRDVDGGIHALVSQDLASLPFHLLYLLLGPGVKESEWVGAMDPTE